jgi:hypothetical protein
MVEEVGAGGIMNGNGRRNGSQDRASRIQMKKQIKSEEDSVLAFSVQFVQYLYWHDMNKSKRVFWVTFCECFGLNSSESKTLSVWPHNKGRHGIQPLDGRQFCFPFCPNLQGKDDHTEGEVAHLLDRFFTCASECTLVDDYHSLGGLGWLIQQFFPFKNLFIHPSG